MHLAALVGVRIRELRVRAGLRQSELADSAGVHRTHVGAIERGERSCTLDVIERIARALQVPPAELLRVEAEADEGPSESLARIVTALATDVDEGEMRRFEELARAFFRAAPRRAARPNCKGAAARPSRSGHSG